MKKTIEKKKTEGTDVYIRYVMCCESLWEMIDINGACKSNRLLEFHYELENGYHHHYECGCYCWFVLLKKQSLFEIHERKDANVFLPF